MRIVFCILAFLVGLAGARAGDDRQKPLGDVPLMHEEAEAAGLHSVYDGPWEFFVGGGGAALDCDGSGFPSVFLAGRQESGAAVRQQVQGRRAAQIRGEGARHRRRSQTLAPMSSAPIRSTSTATATWICSCSGSAATSCSRAARTARSPSPTTNGISTAIRAGRLRSPPNGSRDRNSRRSRSAITSTATRRARPGARARTIRSIALKPATSPTIRVRTPLAPGFCALSMLFTDWNKSGVPSLRVSNDRQYYRGGEEQMWRDRAGQDAEALLPRRRLAAFVDLRHGHRRGRSRRLGLPAIFPHLDGRREAAEARSRRGRPRRSAHLSRHRRRSRRDRAYSLCRRRQAALDRLARRIRRLQQ